MDIVDTQFVVDQPPLPTRALWRALLAIHNYFLVEELAALRLNPEEGRFPPDVVDAVLLLGCWLGTANENGWLGSEEFVH